MRRLFSIALAACALLGLAGTAHAYDCTGANFPVAVVHGDVVINQTGDCIFPRDLKADGNVIITATGKIDATNHKIQAGGSIILTANGGSIDTDTLLASGGDVSLTSATNYVKVHPVHQITQGAPLGPVRGVYAHTSIQMITGSTTGDIVVDSGGKFVANYNNTSSTGHGNVLVRAAGNVSIPNTILGNGENPTGSKAAGVQIDANRAGGNTVLNVGTPTVTSNYIFGIDTRSATGGGSDPLKLSDGIFITNGSDGKNGLPFSTGGITVADGAIQVGNTASKSAFFILNAQDGPLIAPSLISVAGTGDFMAGSIGLFARTLQDTGEGMRLDATQSFSAPGSFHTIAISVKTINHSGVVINNNGNGADAVNRANVQILPQSAMYPTSNNQVNSLEWDFKLADDNASGASKDGTLTFSGVGSVRINSNGANQKIVISGHGITFDTQHITINSLGSTSHDIIIAYLGTNTGAPGLTYPGDLTIDASGCPGGTGGGLSATCGALGNGGNIQIQVDQVVIGNGITNILADGPSGGNGDGGSIVYRAFGTTPNPDGFGLVSASGTGTGKAKQNPFNTSGNFVFAIDFQLGNSSQFGLGQNDFQFSANGATGGTIKVGTNLGAGNSLSFAPDAAANPPVRANSLGSNNEVGGKIQLYSNHIFLPVVTQIQTPIIEAKSTSGTGGVLEFDGTTTTAPANVRIWTDEYFNVKGADALVGQNEADWGRITINGVTCQQRTILNSTVWPRTYWNCVNPDQTIPGSVDDAVPAIAASSRYANLRSQFSSSSHLVRIHVFANSSAYNQFFAEPSPVGSLSGGVTFKGANNNIYSNPFEFGSNGGYGVNYTAAQMQEVTSHELGHAFDLLSNPLPSVGGLYNSYVNRDTATLDYADPAHNTVLRLPCARTVDPAHPDPMDPLHFFPGNAPFAGVTYLPSDPSQSQLVCIGGALNPALPSLSGHKNSEILTNIEPSLWLPDVNLSPAWVEPHAQLFGYNIINSHARPMSDQVFDNGYFPCLKMWAETERTIGAIPGGGCSLEPL